MGRSDDPKHWYQRCIVVSNDLCCKVAISMRSFAMEKAVAAPLAQWVNNHWLLFRQNMAAQKLENKQNMCFCSRMMFGGLLVVDSYPKHKDIRHYE